MYGLNKYKVITIGFICVFVFLVAIMYTTTKNFAQKQNNEQNQNAQQQDFSRVSNSQSVNVSEQSNSNNVNSNAEQLESQISNLKYQLDYLSRDVENLKYSQSQMKCRVQGVYNNGVVDETSSETAIREARANGSEVVLLCSF